MPHFSRSLSEKCGLGITHPQTTLFTEWVRKIWSRLCSTATAYHIPRPYFLLGGCETCGLPHMRLATIPLFVIAMQVSSIHVKMSIKYALLLFIIKNKFGPEIFCVDEFVECEMK